MDIAVEKLDKKYHGMIPDKVSYAVELPRNKNHGDFSTDLAFILSKVLKLPPLSIAEELKDIISAGKYPFFSKIEAVKPGFINFSFYSDEWEAVIDYILKNGKDFGKTDFGKGKKVILEYVSANPTGPLTIAHGRQAAVGDTLANIMSTAGYNVYREYYLNDAGRQIEILGLSVEARFNELIENSSEFPEDGYRGDYIRDIAREILELKGEDFPEKSVKFFSDYAKSKIMDSIKKDLADINVNFDNYFSETSLHGEPIDDVIRILDEKGDLKEEDGALWFLSIKYGDDKDRVLKKRNGKYTYLVPDIAYHRNKFERGFDFVIDLLGPDHHGYINRLKAAVEALGYDKSNLKVLIVQLTTLYKNGEPYKMSTRAGEFISLRQLIDEVGAEPARVFFLLRKVSSLLDFDLDLAKENSQDNPLFYLQYAHARIAGILRFASEKGLVDENIENIESSGLLISEEEVALIKRMHEFPYVILQASRLLEPYRLVEFLIDVAALFHKFYSVCKVVSEDIELTKSRILLCKSAKIVLNNGLSLLGVSAPEKM